MSAGRSTIIITCPDNINTQIVKGAYFLHAEPGEHMQTQAAKTIVSQAHYNEMFEIQASTKGAFERALAEAHHFKIILRQVIAEKQELNLIILGDNPKEWESRQSHNRDIQRAILRKIKIVADKIAAYPRLLTEIDLQKKADIASDEELLEAKRFVEVMARPKEIEHVMHSEMPLNSLTTWLGLAALTCLLLAAILLRLVTISFISMPGIGIGISIALMFLGTGLLGIFMGITSGKQNDEQSLIDHFNFRTGRTEIMKELSKISPDFFENS